MNKDQQNTNNKNLRTESSSYEIDFYITELMLLGIVGGAVTYSICSVAGQCSNLLGISSGHPSY